MSARFIVREATPMDRDNLLALVRSAAQDGAIQISYERDPDYFSALYVASPNPLVWVLEDKLENTIAGAFCLGVRDVYLNGKRTPVWYGNELRLHPNYRGGRALLRLFRQYKSHMGDKWMQTIIMGDNEKSLGSVASGRAGLPTYYSAGGIISHMISTKARIKTAPKTRVRRAEQTDRQAVQNFFNHTAKKKQLCPHYDFARIGTDDPYYKNIKWSDMFIALHGNDIVGMAGIWDQSEFKQSRVRAYSTAVKWARPFYNLWAKVSANIPLPKQGDIAKYAYLHSVLTLNNNPQIFSDLLSTILRETRHSPLDALVVGFDDRDPLGTVLDTIKSRPMPARHFMASHDDNPTHGFDADLIYYVEPARF